MVNLLKFNISQDRLHSLINFKINKMPNEKTEIEHVTKNEFKDAMTRIDEKFDNFRDEFFTYIREIMDEQRAHYEETHTREIGALREHIDHKFAVLMEHPVFSDYQVFADERMNNY